MKKNLLLFFPVVVVTQLVYSQSKSFQINWTDSLGVYATNSKTFRVPVFESQNFVLSSEFGLIYTQQWPENRMVNENSARLTNLVYKDISNADLGDLNPQAITDNHNFSLKNSIARDQRFAVLEINPIIRDNSGLKKLVSFTLNYAYTAFAQSANNFRSAVTSSQPLGVRSSVLSSGNFYKFYIDSTAVYKITARDLQNMGINIRQIDPRSIKIYGHGGRMLPLLNAEPQPFDLPENAIFVSGEADGTFDNEDFILFYGEGPFEWNQESNTNINLYTEETAYLITADGAPGKRVRNAVENTAPANRIVTDYDDFRFHEVDINTVSSVGRQWHGEKFDIEPEQSFVFSFPNLISTEPVRLTVDIAAAADNPTNMSVIVNGQLLTTLGFTAINDPTVGSGRSFSGNINASPGDFTVTLSYNNQGNPAALGFLNYINVEATSALRGMGKTFRFTKNNTTGQGGVADYRFQESQNIAEVWDVTDIENIIVYNNATADANFSFKAPMGSRRLFMALDNADLRSVRVKSRSQIANQDLKGSIFLNSQRQFQDVDYLMIAPDRFMSQAQKLADFHFTRYGRNTKVISLEQIYNEFSASNPDIVAIRNFVRYVYLNASSPDRRVKYLALFGDTSFDYKNRLENNNNILPTFHALSSFSLTGSFMSDDFFTMMDDNEGQVLNSDRMDLAVGRIVADNAQLMNAMVDKIIAFHEREKFGRWRNNFTLLSDDVDQNWEGIIQESLDILGNEISTNKPFINVTKLHSDSFLQELVAGGERYPAVNEAINNAMEVGTVVLNYFGHGGEEGLAAERLITQAEATGFRNDFIQPIFVTVTCEYTRFDNPLRPTAGEFTFWNNKAGAVGLITTTRQVFVQFGLTFNLTLQNYLFSFGSNDFPTLGESLMLAKNSFNNNQKRVVFLVGDPAMILPVPKPNIRLAQINDRPVNLSAIDTIKALGKFKISGEVTDENGGVLNDFNGTVFVTIYDKNLQRQTLANDGTRNVFGQIIRLDFETLGEIIYRGKATVQNGQFNFEFRAPRDLRVPVGKGRMSFYAEKTGTFEDRTGFNNDILVGAIDETAPEDNQGPDIELFMNDENFVSGEITNASPFILALLADENGINTASGIGHDIVGILDGDEANPIIMNDFYETELDDFTKGRVRFPLRNLEPGLHTLKVIAWDVYNNSSMTEIQFVVAGDEELKIDRILNYPNPFIDFTEFWFTHNRPFEPLDVQVQVFTVSGKLVWSTVQVVNTDGFLSRDITWDGRDDFGNKLAKGVYVYKLTVRSSLSNKKVQKIEKLVIL